MKRVAAFGNTGAGKSTLAKHLAELTRLPLYPLELIQYKAGGQVLHDEYLRARAELIRKDEWIIDGFTRYWWVTKRLIKAPLVKAEGWPENSPMWASTVNSYKVVWRCHRRLTPKYRQLVADMANSKRVHHIKSSAEMAAFLDLVKRELRALDLCGRDNVL